MLREQLAGGETIFFETETPEATVLSTAVVSPLSSFRQTASSLRRTQDPRRGGL